MGRRFDNDYSTVPVGRATLGGYVLWNTVLSFSLTPSIELYARVDNLFDKEYEEALGYGTYGAAAFGGIKVEL